MYCAIAQFQRRMGSGSIPRTRCPRSYSTRSCRVRDITRPNPQNTERAAIVCHWCMLAHTCLNAKLLSPAACRVHVAEPALFLDDAPNDAMAPPVGLVEALEEPVPAAQRPRDRRHGLGNMSDHMETRSPKDIASAGTQGFETLTVRRRRCVTCVGSPLEALVQEKHPPPRNSLFLQPEKHQRPPRLPKKLDDCGACRLPVP